MRRVNISLPDFNIKFSDLGKLFDKRKMSQAWVQAMKLDGSIIETNEDKASSLSFIFKIPVSGRNAS